MASEVRKKLLVSKYTTQKFHTESFNLKKPMQWQLRNSISLISLTGLQFWRGTQIIVGMNIGMGKY
jgi:hypothetical protein